MANGFIVTKDDWEHMTPEQQGWMTFNAVQDLNRRMNIIECRPFWDKCASFLGGLIGGIAAALGIKLL